jgi:aldehyde dehydrogenase
MSNVAQRPDFKTKYDNYIGGNCSSIKGAYFDVYSPVDGKVFTQAAHSTRKI